MTNFNTLVMCESKYTLNELVINKFGNEHYLSYRSDWAMSVWLLKGNPFEGDSYWVTKDDGFSLVKKSWISDDEDVVDELYKATNYDELMELFKLSEKYLVD